MPPGISHFPIPSFSESRNSFVCHLLVPSGDKGYERNRRVSQQFPFWNSSPAGHRPFFSVTCAMPILQVLSSDDLASNGGCRGVPTLQKFDPLFPNPYSLSFHILAHSFAHFCTRAKLNSFLFMRFRTLCQKHPGVGDDTSLPYVLTALLRCFNSSRPDREDDSFGPAEGREKRHNLFPREILLVEQRRSAGSLIARDDHGPRFYPLTKDSAARIARSDSHSRIISYAFHLSRYADCVRIQFRIAGIESRRGIRRKPHRCLHAVAALFECFEVQILVPGKRRKSHRIAPAVAILRNSPSMRTILHVSRTQKALQPGRNAFCGTSKIFLLRRRDVRHVFRKGILLFFPERPGGLEMIVVDKGVHRVMHVPVIGALQVRYAHQFERDRLCLRRIRSLHGRLVAGHAIVRQLHLVAIQVIQGGHVHRLAVLHHVELLQHCGAAGRQLHVQRRLVHVRLVGFPVPRKCFQFLECLRPASGRCIRRRHESHRHRQQAQDFPYASHRSFSLQVLFALPWKLHHLKFTVHCAATADSLARPNRCVANPTIAPSNIPGSKMSQNKAIPARRITNRLSPAAIPIPAKIPNSIEWTRCETYPVAIPATNPFSSENVITLPMNGASDGSKNPLKPSRSPSSPPTASPRAGLVRFI